MTYRCGHTRGLLQGFYKQITWVRSTGSLWVLIIYMLAVCPRGRKNLDLVSRETSPYFKHWSFDHLFFLIRKLRRRLHSRLKGKQILTQKSWKYGFFTKMHFLLDITPLLTIFVAIVLTIFLNLCFTCRSVKMVGASLLLLAALT